MELLFGMRIEDATGQEAGTLNRVLVDSRLESATHVVVRSPAVSDEVLVPLSLVLGAEQGTLRLRVTVVELGHLPLYLEGRTGGPRERVETALAEPASSRHLLDEALGLIESIVELGPRTMVTSADGAQAQLVGIGIDSGAPVIDVLYASNAQNERERLPASWIGEVRPDSITLTASRDEASEANEAETAAPHRRTGTG